MYVIKAMKINQTWHVGFSVLFIHFPGVKIAWITWDRLCLLSQSTFVTLVTFTHSHTLMHWWPRLPSKVPTAHRSDRGISQTQMASSTPFPHFTTASFISISSSYTSSSITSLLLWTLCNLLPCCELNRHFPARPFTVMLPLWRFNTTILADIDVKNDQIDL